MTSLLTLARKALNKPPRVVLARARAEALSAWERTALPLLGPGLSISDVLRALGDVSLDACWARLARRPFPAYCAPMAGAELDALCPGESLRVLAGAARALRHEVALLGMPMTPLGQSIDWQLDYKSQIRWAPAHHTRIAYATPNDASDVKIAWEISRLHWALPLCRAYQLTGDETYAAEMRAIFESWIEDNPYACSVNWACTMEVALRIVSWTYAFHVFANTEAWSDTAFRARFLETLYLHCRFTRRHFEMSDVNGNHCTADAAGLVIGALFFGDGRESSQWLDFGWQVLLNELPAQVFPDGVDYEASSAYHRLVTELFFLPAWHRQLCNQPVPAWYIDRLAAMAGFTSAYTRPDGCAPRWGDADDARALPLGTQDINDHRYIPGWIGLVWNRPELLANAGPPTAEICWSLGIMNAQRLTKGSASSERSVAFRDGGVFIMRSKDDHVFIDCGPVGLAGRGGHGHNDCLSFEATLAGIPLIADCGSFVYTQSYEERNYFRSTNCHNTPKVDGEELNRFISPLHLWNVIPDADPIVREWQTSEAGDVFVGSHTGYTRLGSPVTPVRRIVLLRELSGLVVRDTFEGTGTHSIEIPLHFAPGVSVARTPDVHRWMLCAGGRDFHLGWEGEAWTVDAEPSRVSPSYGVALPAVRLVWRGQWTGTQALACAIWPADAGVASLGEVIGRADTIHLQSSRSSVSRG